MNTRMIQMGTALGAIGVVIAAGTSAGALAPKLPATAHTHGFPAVIRSQPMAATTGQGILQRGTVVKAAEIGPRAALGGGVEMGLADRRGLFGAVYPAIRTQGKWRIDGPLFYRAAADAPNVTSRIAASTDGTVMAWGHGGNFVKTSADQGKHWYEANFPVGVHGADTKGQVLRVRALGEPGARSRFPTRRYLSHNDGRTWHRGRVLAATRN